MPESAGASAPASSALPSPSSAEAWATPISRHVETTELNAPFYSLFENAYLCGSRNLPNTNSVYMCDRCARASPTFVCWHVAGLFVQVCGEAWRRGKVDHVLLCECDHRADELIGFKVDVPGELIANFELVFVQEALKNHFAALFSEPDEAPSVANQHGHF